MNDFYNDEDGFQLPERVEHEAQPEHTVEAEVVTVAAMDFSAERFALPEGTPQWLTVPEMSEILEVSLATMRTLLKEHSVPVLKLGKRVRVSRDVFQKLLDGIYTPMD